MIDVQLMFYYRYEENRQRERRKKVANKNGKCDLIALHFVRQYKSRTNENDELNLKKISETKTIREHENVKSMYFVG